MTCMIKIIIVKDINYYFVKTIELNVIVFFIKIY